MNQFKILIVIGLLFIGGGIYLISLEVSESEERYPFNPFDRRDTNYLYPIFLGSVMIFFGIKKKLRDKSKQESNSKRSKTSPWDKTDKPKNFEEWFFSELSWKQWGIILLFSFVGLAIFGIMLSLLKPNV